MSSKSVGSFQDRILDTLKHMQAEARHLSNQNTKPANSDGASFLEHLKQNVGEVNAAQKKSDHMAMELATGQTTNIHETMIAASQAELSFNLMVQIRNKALEAYNEIMRMPV